MKPMTTDAAGDTRFAKMRGDSVKAALKRPQPLSWQVIDAREVLIIMASCAGESHVRCIDLGLFVLGRKNLVFPVTVRAHWDIPDAFLEILSMHSFQIVLLDTFVTMPAGRRNVFL